MDIHERVKAKRQEILDIAAKHGAYAESTQWLPEELKTKHPEIEWRKISGFRHVLVHDYLDVNIRLIWQIVPQDLPTLKAVVVQMFEELT